MTMNSADNFTTGSRTLNSELVEEFSRSKRSNSSSNYVEIS